MAGCSAPGAFGLEEDLLQVLFYLPLFAHVITAALQGWIEEGCAPPLLATLITVIPKDFQATVAFDQYRPISITCVWYCLILHMFVHCMSPIALHSDSD